MNAPGWPVVLRDGPVLLRPYRRGDAATWAEVRRTNESWLARWEPTAPHGAWWDMNSPTAFRHVHRELRRSAREGVAMPFAVCWVTHDGTSRLVGQLTLGNI